jgi:hypothetical protein
MVRNRPGKQATESSPAIPIDTATKDQDQQAIAASHAKRFASIGEMGSGGHDRTEARLHVAKVH